MKKQKMKAFAFVLALALVISCFLPCGAVYGASTSESSWEGNADTSIHSDVKLSDISGHWGESDIENAVKAGFVKGYEDGTFKPDKAVTRAEFVTMVNKALQLRDGNTVKLLFQDVKETAWYYKDIQKASYAKYVNGISNTSFMPNKNITREEAAVMLTGFLPKEGYQTETALGTHADKLQISSWAKDAMAVVINKAYLTGYANGNLAPKATLTRTEAAKIIGEILNKETVVREDVSVKNTGEILKDKIYVGDITIEKSVGEGEASLENLSALSRVYVKGGGTNTVTISNSTVIQLIVCKEGTKVRVLTGDGSTIYNTFVFNGNLLVDSQGQSAEAGENVYENIIYLNGAVTADTAIKIADAIADRMDNTGAITQEQVSEGVAAVVTGSTAAVNPDGSITVTVSGSPATSTSSGGHHSGGSGGSGGGVLTVNGLPATLSAITGTVCSCSLPLTSAGAFTKEIEFDPDGVSGGQTITGFAIYTEAQLQHLAMHLNANAVLMNNLDFSNITTGSADPSTPMGALKAASDAGLYTTGHAIGDYDTGNFVPIGDYASNPYPYTGTFCGNGKSITGLIVFGDTTTTTYCVGLFGYTSGAVIKDLTISGGAFIGRYLVGSVVGESGFGTTLSGIYNTGTVTGSGYIGGLVGENFGTVSNSHNSGTVDGDDGVGGLVGRNQNGTVTHCYNTGMVNGSSTDVAGVVAYNAAGEISGCYNTGIVTGLYCIGGVAGENYGGSVDSSYNAGVINGANNNVGGVVGYNDETVSNSHNTGTVNGADFVGGLVGRNQNGTVTNCYNIGAVTGTANNAYVGGVAGYNSAGSTVSGIWLEGANLSGTPAGIGTGSGITVTFAATGSTISAIYASMSAIASNTGGDETGAIAGMVFGCDGTIPNVFQTLQGSYIFSQSDLTFKLYTISDDVTVVVTTGTSLGMLLTSNEDGISPADASNGYTFSLSGLASSTWILIKADDQVNPKLNRIYTIYIK